MPDIKNNTDLLEKLPEHIEIYLDENPTIGRIVVAGPFIDNAKSRQILEEIIQFWPESIDVTCLITCGGFLNFPWPNDLNNISDPLNPDDEVLVNLFNAAELVCRNILSADIRKKLSEKTKFLTLGIDSYSDSENYSLSKPHVELVAIIDLNSNHYHWTGKSYPIVTQEKGLIRIKKIQSHFLKTPIGKILILGCHDLNIFSPRGIAVTKKKWRIIIRRDFKEIIEQFQPDIILHHPHTTDSYKIWSPGMTCINKEYPFVKIFLSSGRYYNDVFSPRQDIIQVLNNTKRGRTLDFVYHIW